MDDLPFTLIILIFLIILGIFIALLIVFFAFFRKTNSTKITDLNKMDKNTAIDELRLLLKQKPRSFKVRLKLADLLSAKKSFLQAIKEYLIVIDHYSNISTKEEAKILSSIGINYLKLGNKEEAKKYFLLSKQKESINIEANLELGKMEFATKNYEKCLEYLLPIKLIDKNNIDILKNIALAYYAMSNYTSAIEYLMKLYDKIQDDEIAYFLANSLYKNKNYELSIKYFNLASKNDKYNIDCYFHLGMISFLKKEFQRAIDQFEEILKLNPNDEKIILETYYRIGECYFNLKMIKKALSYWDNVATIDPEYRDIANKIENYKSIRYDDLFELYITGSVDKFIQICKYVVEYYLKNYSKVKGKIKYIKVEKSEDGNLEVFAEINGANFIDQYLFIFMRSVTTIGDFMIRNIYSQLKDVKADRGVCVTAGDFSKKARIFVETRMIELVQKDQLVEMLHEIAKKLS